jgi:hypothetical protein
MPVSATAILDLAAVVGVPGVPGHIQVLPEEEPYVETLIESATARIESYCGRPFVTRAFEEEYNGTGSPLLVLHQAPVASDPMVEIDGAAVTGFKVQQKTGHMYLGSGTGHHHHGVWPKGFLNIKVTYRAGYGTRAQVPADVQHACRILVATWFANRDGATESKAEGMSTSYILPRLDAELPTDVRTILAPYVRVTA